MTINKIILNITGDDFVKLKVKLVVLLFFLLGCVTIVKPLSAQAKSVIIAYDEPKGFTEQAFYMKGLYAPSAVIYTCRTSTDFIHIWNKIQSDYQRRGLKIENLILMLHGGKGALYFYNSSIKNFSGLYYLGGAMTGKIMLLSCQGGTGRDESVAYQLAKRSGKSVIAAKNSPVNYYRTTREPYLKDRDKGNWIMVDNPKSRYYSRSLGKKWDYDYLK